MTHRFSIQVWQQAHHRDGYMAQGRGLADFISGGRR